MRELEEEGEGEKKGGKELEGEDFPGKFGKPPDRQMRQGPLSQKGANLTPFRG